MWYGSLNERYHQKITDEVWYGLLKADREIK